MRLAARTLSRDGGIALMMVVFPLLIITAIAADLTANTRTDLQFSRNVATAFQNQLASEAAISLVTFELLSGLPSAPTLDGRATTRTIDGIEVHVSAQNEAGKINLNEPTNPALHRLLQLSCLSPANAAAVADAVADYVDGDDQPRPHGMEAEGYRSNNMPTGPRNGRLQTLGEVRRVPGMTYELFERIRQHVTPYSFEKTPDLRVASRITRTAVTGPDAQLDHSNLQTSPSDIAAGPVIGIVTLIAWTRSNGLDHPATSNTVYLTGNPNEPFKVLEHYRVVAPSSSIEKCRNDRE